MKNLFFGIISLLLFSCSNYDGFSEITNKQESLLPSTNVEIITKDGVTNTDYIRKTRSYIDEFTQVNELYNVTGKAEEFIAKFPEKSYNGKGYDKDFLFLSNGKPFTIYPIYSNTSNNVTLGVYYYTPEGIKYKDIWTMDSTWYADGIHVDSREYYYKVIKTYTRGVQIALPQNTLYGYYTHNNNNKQETFYTEKLLNISCQTNSKCKSIHSATYIDSDNAFIGFEDGHSDADYNDLICYINPKQIVVVEPNDSINYNQGIEVDVHQQEHKDWEEIKTSIHIRSLIDSIKVTLPIEKSYVIEADDFSIRTFDAYYTINDSTYNIKVEVEHADSAVTFTVKQLSNNIICELLKRTHDGITVEIHSYTNPIAITRKETYIKLKNTKVKVFGNTLIPLVHISSAVE